MAPSWVILSVLLTCFTPISLAQLLFNDIFGESDSCENVCENTFPLHTYEKAIHLSYCRRGCRLFTIIDFVDEYSNLNQTRSACIDSCKEAYIEIDNQDACNVGCTGQLPVVERRQKQLESLEPQTSVYYPLMYVHDWYSNMVDKLSQQMSVSWTFYMQADNGQMVVIKSEPKYFINNDGNGWKEESASDYKTSNYMETNLAEVDNSATPDLKYSQGHAMVRDLGDEDEVEHTPTSADWLSCIAKKTGVPRLLLAGTIFVSAFVMIWICLSSAVTAPDQRVAAQPQKLSIYGDLEYLRDINGDKSPLVVTYTPQEFSENAPPLPIKVKVERI